MIRKNELNFKLFFIKDSGKVIHNRYMAHFKVCLETCPTCLQKGGCRVHGYYRRYIIDFVHGRIEVSEIKILRVVCGSCGHTHAILTDPIIPYEIHSLFFILRVLAEYSLHRMTIEKLCRMYDISIPTLYRWRNLFKEHQVEWQGILSAMKTSICKAIYHLSKINPYRIFASEFFLSTGLSFMQHHKNPACNRRGAPPRISGFT